jgi:hypothetical protein
MSASLGPGRRNTAGSLAAGARAASSLAGLACARASDAAGGVRIDAGGGAHPGRKQGLRARFASAGRGPLVRHGLPPQGRRSLPRPAHLRRVAITLEIWPLRALPPCVAARGLYPWAGPAAHDLAAPDGPHRASANGGLRGRGAACARRRACGLRQVRSRPLGTCISGPGLLHFFSGSSPFSSPRVFRLLSTSHCF